MKDGLDLQSFFYLFGPHMRGTPNTGSNPLAQDAVERAYFFDAPTASLDSFQKMFGHQNAHGPRPPHKGSGFGGMGGAIGDYAYGKEQWRADQQRKKDLEYQRQQLEMQNYFNNKQIGDKMNLIQQFFGRNPNGYHSTSTEHTQELVNNAGRHEPRPITTTTTTDMTMQILQQLLGG